MASLRARFLAPAIAAGLILSLLAGCGSDDTETPSATTAALGTTTSSAPAEEVVKDVLAERVDPPGAPGYTLTLIRYTIAPGAQLAPHVHPACRWRRSTAARSATPW